MGNGVECANANAALFLVYVWAINNLSLLKIEKRLITLSESRFSSRVSKRASASEYLPASTNSSICSAHGLIVNLHRELPSFAAAALSTGVVRAYSGDFADGEDVNNRMVAFCSAVGSETLNGKGTVWQTWREREDLIWITDVGFNTGWVWAIVALAGDSTGWACVGRVPAGKTEKR